MELLQYLCEICAGGVGAQQFALYVFLNTLNDTVFMQEVHLVFRGVDIHIYIMWGNLQAMVMTNTVNTNCIEPQCLPVEDTMKILLPEI